MGGWDQFDQQAGRSASSRGALASEIADVVGGPFTRLGNLDTHLQAAEKSLAWR
jgi:hypothetical protein